MKSEFLKLDLNIQNKVCLSPHTVFNTLNPDDETDEQAIERQERFLKLPESIKDKLVSNETAERIKTIGAHYKLELLQMAPIARVVRSYYFGEAKLEDFASIIEKESKVSRENAESIAKYIADRIINKSITLKSTVKKEKMTINQILERYPEVGKKSLTSSPIELEGRTVSPTIENWIIDYFGLIGAGNKDVMKRSGYLYHSKNTKGLNMSDRQKLSRVLKSVDDNSVLDVDIDKKEIIFNEILAENKNSFQINKIDDKKKEAIIYQKTLLSKDVFQKTEKMDRSAIPNKRFMDGFGGADKKETASAQPMEKITRVDDISFSNRHNESGLKKDRFDILVGSKKREEFDKKVLENSGDYQKNTNSLQNKILPDEDKRKNIQHVRGNSWDLGSSNFLNKTALADDTKNIKFSSPQQLPVEKEIDDSADILKAKTEKSNNFLGKIKPIE